MLGIVKMQSAPNLLSKSVSQRSVKTNQGTLDLFFFKKDSSYKIKVQYPIALSKNGVISVTTAFPIDHPTTLHFVINYFFIFS